MLGPSGVLLQRHWREAAGARMFRLDSEEIVRAILVTHPSCPPKGFCGAFVSLPCVEIRSPLDEVPVVSGRGPRLGLEPMKMDQLISAVRLGATLKSQRHLKKGCERGS